MRILCLHGVGSSGDILRAQLTPLSRALDPSIELSFTDGPFPCPRGPGIPENQEGPFFSHTPSYEPDGMAVAVQHLRETLDDMGPFDGVFAFSQGAAVLIPYLHEQQSKGEPLGIGFAIICSSAMPCASDASLGQEVVQELVEQHIDVTDAGAVQDKSISLDARNFVDTLQKTIVPAWKHYSLMPRFDVGIYEEDDSRAPRAMAPVIIDEKIELPTVHIRGKKDADYMWNMSKVAQEAFEPDLLKVIEHESGHAPPTKDAPVKATVRAMDWAVKRAVL
ncbi:hypothetical protein CERZMDRAFT_94821 [Cercospora zeae-maydis SCOH1-5]|uniref:Serine hydrolase domain-containing protein n=1 Tax=Cercospora zeae-maydis SCOH1-5 TaxID=717836 RepID=A0A6A6FPR7_9PEZI|nr:hypothetical protein CERZMDRAFT_94821 [Cercospora zeae-maydis SCOH1-5]